MYLPSRLKTNSCSSPGIYAVTIEYEYVTEPSLPIPATMPVEFCQQRLELLFPPE